MMQIINLTDEEKLQMYKKLTKHELAIMLISCNKMIDQLVSLQPHIVKPISKT